LYFQLSTGKTVYLTIEEYLDLTDQDIQYLMSLDSGESILNPFQGSAVDKTETQKHYDFEYLSLDEDESLCSDIPSDDESFDDIIDLEGPLDM
jgi:hypothetical protein